MDENGLDINLLPPEQNGDQDIGRNRFASVTDLLQRLGLPFKLTPQEKRQALLSLAAAFAITTYIDPLDYRSPVQFNAPEISQPPSSHLPGVENEEPEDAIVDYTGYEVNQELANYQRDYLRIMLTSHWKGLVENVVQDPRLKIAKNEQGFWTRTILGIIFVESGGNPFATSSLPLDPARGLVQVRSATADELAGQYKIPQYNLYNSWDNVFLGLTHQLKLADRYGNELSIWAHHLGSGNMDAALRAYLVSELNLPISRVADIFSSPNGNQILTDLIKNYDIRVGKLLASPAVTATLKSKQAFGNSTERYFYRVLAAQKAMGTIN